MTNRLIVEVRKDKRRGDRVMTPQWVARDMIDWFQPVGRILEPFRGDGIFTGMLPNAMSCEIDDGEDFFDWHESADWIITNPPYSKTRACFNHAAQLADNIVFLVPLRNIFSGYGFVCEIYRYGGIAAIRMYGTGGRVGFPMGNAIGAMHFQRGYEGPTHWSFYERRLPTLRDGSGLRRG